MNDAAVPEISPHEASELVRRGAALLDVREDSEWDAGHAEGAVHMPLAQLDPLRLPAGHRVVAVCRSGNRSGQAAAWLRAEGYDVHNLEGGMAAWERAGLQVVTNTGAPGHVA